MEEQDLEDLEVMLIKMKVINFSNDQPTGRVVCRLLILVFWGRRSQFVQNGEDNDYNCYCGKTVSSSKSDRFGGGRSKHF